jgi:hypothetical protein
LEESVAKNKAHTLNLEIMMRLVETTTFAGRKRRTTVRDLTRRLLERIKKTYDEFDVVDDTVREFKFEELATKESVKVVTNVKQLHEESGQDASSGSPQQLQPALSGG